MKLARRLFASILLAALPCAALLAASEPEYLDFANLPSASGAESVDIDLDEGLLSLAARFVDVQEKEAAQLLRGLKHVRVHVLGLNEGNRSTVVAKVHKAREGLAKDGWKRIASVRDNGEADVAIFARTKGDEAVQGLVVTVLDGNHQAVVVNVSGEIRPEQISALANRLDIEPLKKISVVRKN